MTPKTSDSEGKRKAKTATKKARPKRKAKSGSVDTYRHRNVRTNLPTDQTARTMKHADARPVPYKVPSKGTSHIPKDLYPPHLQWKREMPDSTPAGPLYIHEKIHPAAFAKSLKRHHLISLDFFGRQYDGLPEGAEFQWYKHSGHWQNRIVRGESRHVMASLLAKEGMTGKVQMIYYDPPYGINFRNILQANVDRNQNSDELPNDTVALQTFRDTYKNGIHSYLDNIYQIASHARELLNETGSFFLQIGSANVNRIGVVLDEVFGAENRMGMIAFAKSGGKATNVLPDVTDYLLWYAKDAESVKYHQLYEPMIKRKDMLELMSSYAMVEEKDRNVRNLTKDEKKDPDNMPEGAKLFKKTAITSQGSSRTRSGDYEWNGKVWKCPQDMHWSISYEGLDRMAKMDRLVYGPTLMWKRYEDEIPGRRINNIWSKQQFSTDKHYVVETAESTIERCMLMTTDPGDLVFDPTCGSGTTAYTAEKWGRRWITSDASLVAVNLARQRIITGIFPWFTLIDSEDGLRRENELRKKTHQQTLDVKTKYNEDPSMGFVYERLPHVSAQFLAYPNREAPIDYMFDRPEMDKGKLRVSSPFTIESLSPYRYVNPNQPTGDMHTSTRQSIISALRDTGITIEGSNVTLSDIEEYPGKIITHRATFRGENACILVANDDCTIPPIMVDHAVEEASKMPSVSVLIIVAFAYEASVENEQRGRMKIHRMMANQDLQMGNLKDNKNDVAFVLVGEPEIKTKSSDDKMTVKILGYDTFDPVTGNTKEVTVEEGTKQYIYCWMLDTEYDGRSFFARRVHFPGAENDKQISNFYKKLQRHIDMDLWDSMLTLESAPFAIPKSGRIAVKIITSTHSEMTRIIEVGKRNA